MSACPVNNGLGRGGPLPSGTADGHGMVRPG